MKTSIQFSKSSRQRQRGMAVIIVLALLSIILIHVLANTCSLNNVERELKLIEQRQIQRLRGLKTAASTPSPTNTPPAIQVGPTESVP